MIQFSNTHHCKPIKQSNNPGPWYVIHNQNGTDYSKGNENGTSAKFETKNIKSSLCDYLDAYILVTGDILVTATGGDENTEVGFKNCAPFTKCITHINDEHIDITIKTLMKTLMLRCLCTILLSVAIIIQTV